MTQKDKENFEHAAQLANKLRVEVQKGLKVLERTDLGKNLVAKITKAVQDNDVQALEKLEKELNRKLK